MGLPQLTPRSGLRSRELGINKFRLPPFRPVRLHGKRKPFATEPLFPGPTPDTRTYIDDYNLSLWVPVASRFILFPPPLTAIPRFISSVLYCTLHLKPWSLLRISALPDPDSVRVTPYLRLRSALCIA